MKTNVPFALLRRSFFAATVSAVLALPALAADNVKIGLLSTLSGPGAGLGIDIRDGFQLAVKLNGGKLGGLPAEVIVADDQASPDVGRQTADRLVKRDKVDFMTGIVFSNVMLAVGAPTFAAKTFYISANAGPSQLAGEQCNPYFFSASYQNDNQHEAVGKTV
ncbi:MAG: ABC transporter substrate-binding protein, partial [Hylemonella sp.]